MHVPDLPTEHRDNLLHALSLCAKAEVSGMPAIVAAAERGAPVSLHSVAALRLVVEYLTGEEFSEMLETEAAAFDEVSIHRHILAAYIVGARMGSLAAGNAAAVARCSELESEIKQ